MPYDSIAELPRSVRESLPKRAQQIYLRVFNSAWSEYADPGRRRAAGASREETAHKVAWAAVKESYEKKGGRWVEKT